LKRTLIITLGAGLIAAGVAMPAAAAAQSPGTTCQTGSIQGPDGSLPLTGPGGYFYKQGGCASSVAHGALDNNGANLSALTTQAGYVQTCQLIRSVGDYPAINGEAAQFGLNVPPATNIPTCVVVLRALHSAFG
jgi:hypothetical protein